MHLLKCKDMQRIIQLTSNFYNRVHWFIYLLQALAWGSSPLTSLANLMCQVHEELWPHDRLWQPQYAIIAKFARRHNIQCGNTTCGNQCGTVQGLQSQLLPSSSSVSGESSCTYPITSSQCQVGKNDTQGLLKQLWRAVKEEEEGTVVA